MTTKLTVYFDGRFWRGVFERNSHDGYSVAKVVFGAEPSDAELILFIRFRMHSLTFSDPSSDESQQEEKKINPKRMQKLIRRGIETKGTSTKSQEAMRLQTEARKAERKQHAKERSMEKNELKFRIKQERKKEKHKGH